MRGVGVQQVSVLLEVAVVGLAFAVGDRVALSREHPVGLDVIAEVAQELGLATLDLLLEGD